MACQAITVTTAGLFLGIFILAAPVSSQQRYTHTLKIKYFTDISMICDHPSLNISLSTDIRSMTWVFPDGRTIDKTSYLDPSMFSLTGPSPEVPVTNAVDMSQLATYNLTAFKVVNEMYGYYTCVVVYQSDAQISTIRWALNVDGADFSDLIETYKENAIVGGIAAAVLFVLVSASCLIWHFRFSNRDEDDSTDSAESTVKDAELKDVSTFGVHAYSNNSYNHDEDVAETKMADIKTDEDMSEVRVDEDMSEVRLDEVMSEIRVDNEQEEEANGGDPNFKIARYRL